MSVTVYRVQDADGRGPFKPGFSRYWLDHDRDDWPPPFFEEFPGLRFPDGGHIGCGCRTLDGVRRWFNDRELSTLAAAGYQVVAIDADRVLAESEHQIVFWRRRPLRFGAQAVIGRAIVAAEGE